MRFVEIERAIADSDIAGVSGVVLRGSKPAARLAGYAEGTGADLIAVGTHGRRCSQSVSMAA